MNKHYDVAWWRNKPNGLTGLRGTKGVVMQRRYYSANCLISNWLKTI